MSDPLTGLIAALWKLIGGVLPAAAGALISLRLNTADLSFGTRLIAFLSAFALGHYLGAAVAQQYALEGPKAEAASLVIALFGLNLVAILAAQLPSLFDLAKRRILGDTQ